MPRNKKDRQTDRKVPGEHGVLPGCCELGPGYSSLQEAVLLSFCVPRLSSAYRFLDVPTEFLVFFLWKAVYDLEIGQVLTTRVHTSGFIAPSF